MIRGTSGIYNSGNTTAWQTTSDSRIKKNIVDNNTGLDILNQIQVRNFEYRTEEEIIQDAPELTDVIKSAVVSFTAIAPPFVEVVVPAANSFVYTIILLIK